MVQCVLLNKKPTDVLLQFAVFLASDSDAW